MYIEQMYTACLAEAAYYIESEGEAIVIDPIREPFPYLNKLKERNARLKYVLETHFHADFVSGHLDLAQSTQATIVYGPEAHTKYEVYHAKDGEKLQLGKITIEVLHTPGHTPESTSYLLRDENGKEHALFSGDTLFVGDVGRPDLTTASHLTPEILAGQLYDSIQAKIMPLPDDVLVYPAHGPGSACGKNLGKETWSTIGEQKQKNYALKATSKENFIKELTEGLAPPPTYFFEDARINQNGYQPLNEVMQKNTQPLNIMQCLEAMNNGAMVLDTRAPEVFAQGFIPNSINIGIDGTFAVWVGALIPFDKKIIIVAEDNRVEEAIIRLARVGYENVLGYVDGGFESWKNENLSIETIPSITPEEFKLLYDAAPENCNILDVRKPGEFADIRLLNARLIPLDTLNQNIPDLDKKTTYFIHCAGGYRSMMAASMMRQSEIENVINISGGMAKIKTAVPQMLENVK